jgi:hypothetical protein
MSSLITYNGIQIVTPDPTGDGGLALNNNFKALSNRQQARITFDGGGSAIAGTPLAWFVCAFAGTISGYTLLADQVGSIVIAVKKATYAAFPTFTSITGSGAKPTLASAQKSQDLVLTGWSLAVAAGDILQFQISSSSTVQHVQLALMID